MLQVLPADSCTECPIRHRAVCAECGPSDLVLLEKMKTYKTYRAGEPIVWAGDRMQHLGSVVSGCATLSRTLEDGRRQMVGLLLPSDFVGRPGRAVAAYDVTAVTDVTMCRFEKTQFEKLISTSKAIEHRMLEMTLDELDAAREWMLILGRKTAREKIASLLAVLARRDTMLATSQVTGRVAFNLQLTREAMADYLGMTIETVSRQISALKRDGIIQLDGVRRVIIPDYEALMEEAQDETYLD